MTDTMLTTAQIAAHFHVKVGTIRNWVADGCPAERRGKGKPVLYDLDKVKQWKTSSSSSGANLDPQREKALLDRERRLKVTTERKVLEGKLIPAAEVEDHWGQLVGNARAKFLSLPVKIAPAVIACNSIAEVENEARRLINEALAELAGSGMPDTGNMETTGESDDQPVGGHVPETEPGEFSGAGPVGDG
jgi:hypothetical protein